MAANVFNFTNGNLLSKKYWFIRLYRYTPFFFRSETIIIYFIHFLNYFLFPYWPILLIFKIDLNYMIHLLTWWSVFIICLYQQKMTFDNEFFQAQNSTWLRSNKTNIDLWGLAYFKLWISEERLWHSILFASAIS